MGRRKPRVVEVTGKWAPGAKIKNKPSADDAAFEVTEMRKEYGRANAQTLVEWASDPDSCFHGSFDWDDASAAQKHRLEHARMILRHLEVITPGGRRGRALVAVTIRDSAGVSCERFRDYVPVADAMKVPEWKAEVLANALRDLRAFRSRYGAFKELSALMDSIDRLIVKYEKDS